MTKGGELGWWVSFMIHWVWAVHQCLCISWRAGKSPLKCVAFLYGAVFVPDDTAAQQDAFNGTENAGAHAKFLQVPEVVQGLLSLPHHIIGVHVDHLGSSVMVIWGSVNVNGVMLSRCLLEIHDQLLGLINTEGKVFLVIKKPLCQMTDHPWLYPSYYF